MNTEAPEGQCVVVPRIPSVEIAGRIATITLRRPSTANCLQREDLAELFRLIQAVNASDALVLRIKALGKHFCSGFQITSIGGAREGPGFGDVVDALEDCRAVTIASINGGVYGGATDLALACDFRVGVKTADMFMPAARLGLHFYQRGMERFVSRLGVDAAKRLFLTAERLDAAEMLRIGFLTECVADGTLEQQVDRLTDTLVGMAPLALLGMKKHLNRIARGVLDPEDFERDRALAANSQDLKEGALAWKEKRAAKFQGR